MNYRPVKVRFILLILLTFIEAHAVFAQTDSLLNFYPLHSGDLRQYFYYATWTSCPPYPPTFHTDSSFHVERVMGDTVLSTGHTYKIVQTNIPIEGASHFRRVDTLSANVYEYVEDPHPHEVLTDSLRANPGDVFSGGSRECIGTDTSVVLGSVRVSKHFVWNIIPNQYYSLTYGLGRVSLVTSQDDPCYNTADPITLDLNYAMVDGSEFGTLTAANDSRTQFPTRYHLQQNFPNPFNPVTTIQYSLPLQVHVDLRLFDVLGREMEILVNEIESPGEKSIVFDASRFSTGVYFYRLVAGGFVETKQLVLLK